MKANRAMRAILSYVPTPIPKAEADILAWMDDVLDLAGFPANPSTKHALATQIMHLGERETRKSKQFFVKTLHMAFTKQATFNILQDINEEQKAKRNEQSKGLEGSAAEVVQEVS